LTLEKPERFPKSRDVGPYVGLVPKQEDSGESQPQLGISKAGDTMVRKLLVGSAHYILGPFGPDTDLRRYGLRLCQPYCAQELCAIFRGFQGQIAVFVRILTASGPKSWSLP